MQDIVIYPLPINRLQAPQNFFCYTVEVETQNLQWTT